MWMNETMMKPMTYETVCAAWCRTSWSPSAVKIATTQGSITVCRVSMPTAPRPSETKVMPTWVTE